VVDMVPFLYSCRQQAIEQGFLRTTFFSSGDSPEIHCRCLEVRVSLLDLIHFLLTHCRHEPSKPCWDVLINTLF